MPVVDFNRRQADEKLSHFGFMLQRMVIASVLASLMTIFLLYVMQTLISNSESELDPVPSMHLVDFVRVKQAQDLKVRERRPKEPPPPEEQPPAVPKTDFNIAMDNSGFGLDFLDAGADIESSSIFGFVSDSSYLPIVRVQPVYPRSALMKGQEGWVVLEFTVDELGRVVDPVVTDHCVHTVPRGGTEEECWDNPDRLFDLSAIKAVRKFKYKPKVESGTAIATHHVRHKFTFELDRE